MGSFYMENWNMLKTDYINEISKMSDRRGNELIAMMDRYNRICLDDITYKEAKEYYNELKERKLWLHWLDGIYTKQNLLNGNVHYGWN